MNDIPSLPGELTGAFVLATVGNCDLDVVDPSAALVIPTLLKKDKNFGENYKSSVLALGSSLKECV